MFLERREMFLAVKRYLRYTNWPIIAAMLALIVFGVMAIRVSEQANPSIAGQSAKQMKYAAVGLLVFLAATIVPYPRVGRIAYPLFAFTIGLLIVVLFTPKINNSHRWIPLWLIRVQPSEIAKLSYIIMLAWYLRFGDRYRRLRGLVMPFGLAFIPMGLILYEPDLGTALLFGPTLYFMLFMAGAKLRHLLVIVAIGLAVMLFPVPRKVDQATLKIQAPRFDVLKYGPLKFYRVRDPLELSRPPKVPVSYFRVQVGDGGVYDVQPLSLRVLMRRQVGRIEGWLRQGHPRVVLREGFQLRWSLITICAGRWKGSPRAGGGDENFDFLPLALNQLPEDHTDFIFSVIGGRWGLAGALALLAMYAIIIIFGIEIATITYDPFGRLLAVGVLGLLLSQVFINVSMAMGLMPITGMTLPLVSYGGTSLVVNCAALGLLINVAQRKAILLSPHPFEYGRKKDKPTNIELAMRHE